MLTLIDTFRATVVIPISYCYKLANILQKWKNDCAFC